MIQRFTSILFLLTAATTTTAMSLATTQQQQKFSFYQRQLPDTCTAFSSPEGKQIFASALANNGLKSFYSLIQQFSTQTEPAYCGLTTLALVLNALSVDPLVNWKGPWRWFSEEMLNCCVALEDVKKSGITLQDFSCLARCQGLTVDVRYADDQGLAQFRQAVADACLETPPTTVLDEKVLVVSYSRKVLSQTGSGHFSPIAAYDPVSDQVLILDTARFKYGAHWTKLELLYDAMKPVDVATGKSRGYTLLSFKPASPRCCRAGQRGDDPAVVNAVQPMSLLYTSKFNQSPARKKYKNYLTSLLSQQHENELTFEQVLEYWSDGNDKSNAPTPLWDILKTLPHPKDSEEHKAAQKIRNLIDDLLERYNVKETGNDNAYRALFVVYLASVDETSRVRIVQDVAAAEGTHSQLTMEQLWNEAALVSAAIETSDQTDLCSCCKNNG
eukprot:scaffold2253_cov119-Cylindrotheca_fusiformis.AAC.20